MIQDVDSNANKMSKTKSQTKLYSPKIVEDSLEKNASPPDPSRKNKNISFDSKRMLIET